MPEGPEVKRMAFCLNERIQNLNCECIFITYKNKFHKEGKFHRSPFIFSPINENLSYLNVGKICNSVFSYGKKIIFYS